MFSDDDINVFPLSMSISIIRSIFFPDPLSKKFLDTLVERVEKIRAPSSRYDDYKLSKKEKELLNWRSYDNVHASKKDHLRFAAKEILTFILACGLMFSNASKVFVVGADVKGGKTPFFDLSFFAAEDIPHPEKVKRNDFIFTVRLKKKESQSGSITHEVRSVFFTTQKVKNPYPISGVIGTKDSKSRNEGVGINFRQVSSFLESKNKSGHKLRSADKSRVKSGQKSLVKLFFGLESYKFNEIIGDIDSEDDTDDDDSRFFNYLDENAGLI